MNLTSWKHWRILPQIILIAALPSLLMFVSVLAYSYYSRAQEVADEIEERGQLTASLVAQLSEYAVVSGDLAYLSPTAQTLLAKDDSIIAVTIADANKRVLFEFDRQPSARAHLHTFHAPITRQTLSVKDLAEINRMQHADTAAAGAVPLATLGQVTLVMTSEQLLRKQTRRVAVGSLIATLALVTALVLGTWLSVRITGPLTSVIQTIRQIRGGNYAVAPSNVAAGEVGELQRAIFDMAASVADSKRDLETKVAARTSEIRRLLDTVQHVVEEERRYISRELHDHLNAELILVRLEAQQILALSRNATPDNLRELNTHATTITTIANELYTVARGIVRRLRPEVLETMGLQSALEELVKSSQHTKSGCHFQIEAQGEFTDLDDELAITAYRVVQEALSNVVRHAKATQATVRVCATADTLAITIQDNGVGFNPTDSSLGVGIIGMRERAQSLGGSLRIHSDEHGTRVALTLPLRRVSGADTPASTDVPAPGGHDAPL
jgi:two-component system sensor histidine kinase UhpB